MKLLVSYIRRVRSVVALCGTVSVLLYYTFLNEVNTLNSYAETESLPQIDKHIPLVPNGVAVAEIAGLEGLPSVARPAANDAEEELLNLEILVEKNRFFPLIHRQEEVLTLYPQLELELESEKITDKPRYPIRYASSKNSLTHNKPSGALRRTQALNFGRKDAVKAAQICERIEHQFMTSWRAYSRLALGSDELKPLSKNPTSNGLSRATTMLESLDMLYILNQPDDISKVLTFISEMDFTRSKEALIDVSQSAQRLLGALISSYELSGHQETILLTKAKELADLLLKSFDTPNHVPLLQYPWNSVLNNRFPFQNSNIGQLGAFSLEFSRLSQLTKDDKYFEAIEHIYQTAFESLGNFDIDYLLPSFVDATGCEMIPQDKLVTGEHPNGNVMKSIMQGEYVHCLQTDRFKPVPGSEKTIFSADSASLPFYDNMAKFYQLLNGVDTTKDLKLSRFLVNSFDRIRQLMVFTPLLPNPEGLNLSYVNSVSTEVYYRALNDERIVEISPDYTMHHSSCALASSFTLMGKLLADDDYIEKAKSITRGCVQTYKLLGVMPDAVHAFKCANSPCDFDSSKPPNRDQKGARKGKGIKVGDDNDGNAVSTLSSKYYHLGEEIVSDQARESEQWVTDTQLPKYFDGAIPSYNLSSDVIESIFYLYRTTGEESWRDIGLELLETTMKTIERPSAKGVGQISSLKNVFTGERFDALPADWFSKHLKFYYLLFQDPALFSLDDYIFTHAGHLLMKEKSPVPSAKEAKETSISALVEPFELKEDNTARRHSAGTD
ncbi:LADA_0C11320g1_1 [Lachancea dasiensis]|uniref:alpha-1,2-Mannosidase n=1 Tax=Lachancea dasiensis TaxID=1072105 RepID=A0A1G4J1D5_9SACH|nr:LADA_0C11320g1_1 [Lachancea dasiensis]